MAAVCHSWPCSHRSAWRRRVRLEASTSTAALGPQRGQVAKAENGPVGCRMIHSSPPSCQWQRAVGKEEGNKEPEAVVVYGVSVGLRLLAAKGASEADQVHLSSGFSAAVPADDCPGKRGRAESLSGGRTFGPMAVFAVDGRWHLGKRDDG